MLNLPKLQFNHLKDDVIPLLWLRGSLLWPFQTVLIISLGHCSKPLCSNVIRRFLAGPKSSDSDFSLDTLQSWSWLELDSLYATSSSHISQNTIFLVNQQFVFPTSGPMETSDWRQYQTVAHHLFLNPLSTVLVRCWEAALANSILAARCRVGQRKHQTLNITGSYHYIHRSMALSFIMLSTAQINSSTVPPPPPCSAFCIFIYCFWCLSVL